jgi:hypothetical protein
VKIYTRITVAIALILVVSLASAELIVIGDVDAPNTASRPQNYDLLENVRNGGTDILWLTGGYAVNSRYTDLRSRWTTAGATITDDVTTDVGTTLTGRDLVVVSQLWCNDSLFDAGAISAISSYAGGGGEVLYIAQVCSEQQLNSYNAFLTAIGSSMQFLPDSGDTSGDEVIDTSTPYGAGVTAFDLGGWTALSGGTPVVTLNDEVGVAFGDAVAAIVEPVPTLSFWAITALIVLLGMIVFGQRKRFLT